MEIVPSLVLNKIFGKMFQVKFQLEIEQPLMTSFLIGTVFKKMTAHPCLGWVLDLVPGQKQGWSAYQTKPPRTKTAVHFMDGFEWPIIRNIKMWMKLDGQTDGRNPSVEACIRLRTQIPGLG